jgi:hypothetical protein
MATFKEIVDEALNNGYKANIEEKFYELILKRKDGIIVEVSFSDDEFLSSLKDGTNISWEFKLMDEKTGKVLYKDWREHYGNGINILIKEMREDVRRLLHDLRICKIIILNKSAFKIFGINILKYKELKLIDPQSENERRN